MSTDVDIRDVTRHEAAHAVICWWWVNRPDSDNHVSYGWFDSTTIKQDEGQPTRYGHTDGPSPVVYNHGDYRPHLEHLIATGLAEPSSGELVGNPGESVYDNAAIPIRSREWLLVAQTRLSKQQVTQITNEVIDQIRPQVTELPQTPEVETMIAAVADALLEHETGEGDTASRVMNAAIGHGTEGSERG
jgi:hypothetical protein